jgi:hypothetical protein
MIKAVNRIILPIAIIVVYILFIVLVLQIPNKRERYIDCSMSSFHPDYSTIAKKACQERLAK